MLLAPALKSGDTIGIFTPSSPAHVSFRERYLNGQQTLRNLGFNVTEGELTVTGLEQGYRSGTPRARAAELMALFRNPDVKAIMSTIGGANSSSLLPYLDFDEIRANPKVFCGYSDVTALHMAIWSQTGLSTFYGPAVVPSLGEFPTGFEYTCESFLDATMRHRAGQRLIQPPVSWSNQAPKFGDANASDPAARIWQDNKGLQTLLPGKISAPIVCANLNTLIAVAGTPYFPRLTGHILMIEEMWAPFSRYERNLRQLQLMGVFDEIAGLIVGKPEIVDFERAPFSTEALLLEILGDVQYPVAYNGDFGHTHPMITLAQGAQISLNAEIEDASITVLAPMVA